MGHLATLKPDKALQGLLQDPVLSDSSKLTYTQRLKAMSAKRGQPITELAMQPKVILPWIQEQYPELATQKNLVTAVLAALKRMPAMNSLCRQALAIWLRASKELEAQQQARLKANEPSARQQRGYVDFRDVIRVRTSLGKGSRQRLLLAFYTMIPPLRCDLNRVALLQCPASAATISQDDVDTVKENNFLCLPADRKKPAILVLREFKTANSAGIWRRTLPMNLTQELWTSLQAESPRRWLFTTKSGSPYTAKNFSKWCCSVLEKLFGRPLTLTLLRHSYLNSMDWNKLTIAARENLAADMCHSTETQDTYRWISGKHRLGFGKRQPNPRLSAAEQAVIDAVPSRA
ncbi:hypothetical protein ABBQ32_010457 [Trebouxia sp. C0010 RCD-2024]